MQSNLQEILKYLAQDNGAPLPRIAKHTNITPGTTSKYLRQLIASGRVTATGWGKMRRYFKN
jgi:DNA-binding IclR family transcriptional regulator